MEREAILIQLTTIFQKEFDNKSIQISDNTTAQDIEEWDSLSHIQLIVAIEKHYKIRFNSSEIQSWKDVGKMIDSLEAKLNK